MAVLNGFKSRVHSRQVGRKSRVIRRIVVITALAIVTPLLVTAQAGSQSIDIVTSSPRAHDVVDGSMVVVALQFDAPVDHQRSQFLLKGSRGVRKLRPRLRSAPKYLFSIVGHLMPGAYELEWDARLSDGRNIKGTIPFTVK